MKKRARAFYPGEDETTAEHDFRALSMLALSYPADPKGLASVYRAMATIPGIEAVQTQDVLNRPAIGIHLPGERDLLLLNAQTSQYRRGLAGLAGGLQRDRQGRGGRGRREGAAFLTRGPDRPSYGSPRGWSPYDGRRAGARRAGPAPPARCPRRPDAETGWPGPPPAG